MEEFSGVVRIENDAGRPAIVLDGQNAAVRLGVRYPDLEGGPSVEVPTSAAAIADDAPSFVKALTPLPAGEGLVDVLVGLR